MPPPSCSIPLPLLAAPAPFSSGPGGSMKHLAAKKHKMHIYFVAEKQISKKKVQAPMHHQARN